MLRARPSTINCCCFPPGQNQLSISAMLHLGAPSESSGDRTSASLTGETSNSDDSMHGANSSVTRTSLKIPKHRQGSLQALVATVTFGGQDRNGSIEINWASVQETINTVREVATSPLGQKQARWFHLPANCMSWVEVELFPPPKMYAIPDLVGYRRQHQWPEVFAFEVREQKPIARRNMGRCMQWPTFKGYPCSLYKAIMCSFLFR